MRHYYRVAGKSSIFYLEVDTEIVLVTRKLITYGENRIVVPDGVVRIEEISAKKFAAMAKR